MPSDRERLSFDSLQQYRSVVAQQGRVTLPADFNEAQEIALQEQRAEALDFVGPAGTPDDGYAISISPQSPQDFDISPGTMYVGGIRATLPAPAKYLNQPDWIDPTPAQGTRELIVLRLEEREISATEDSTLREVALGGPDTSQRTRILQRIMRFPAGGGTCVDALAQQVKQWADEGWSYNPASAALTSTARLQVGFAATGVAATPCEPAATGGYAGAENQLIRVRISSPGKFVWGFDNASFLYRVDVVDSMTVKLQSVPVDQQHFPRKNQAVELLRSELRLANNELVAYGEGLVLTLSDAYNHDAQTLRLPQTIPTAFVPPNGTPRLFLRVWEEELSYTSGVPVKLGNTGLTITLTTPANIHSGDFWAFAARPATPVQLYQDRYRVSPQPPEGPRLWVCPLAVIQSNPGSTTGGNAGTVLSDCREKFDNLVELTKRKSGGGCCTVTLSPDDLKRTGFNELLDSLPADVPVKICLRPGIYTLREPIQVQRSEVTIESCPSGAVLVGRDSDAFDKGMIIVQKVSGITLRGLVVKPDETAFAKTNPLGLKPDQFAGPLRGPDPGRIGLILGIRLVECKDVLIEDCEFPVPAASKAPSTFGAAIYSSGVVRGLILRRNTFLRNFRSADKLGPIVIEERDFRIFFGYLHVPSTRAALTQNQNGALALTGTTLASGLTDAEITANRFAGFSAAVFVQGTLGPVRTANNDVESCYSGFWFLSQRTLAFADRVFTRDHKDLGARLGADEFLADPILFFGSALGRALEPPEKLSGLPFKDVPVAVPTGPPPGLPSNDLVRSIFAIWTDEAAIERAVFTGAAKERPELHFTHNRVDVQVAGTDAPAGPALILWGEDMDKDGVAAVDSSVVADNNDLRTRPVRYGAVIMIFGFATVTGNVIIGNKFSLLVFPAAPARQQPGVAITGNILRGTLTAPPRNLPAPLNTWDVLNTID